MLIPIASSPCNSAPMLNIVMAAADNMSGNLKCFLCWMQETAFLGYPVVAYNCFEFGSHANPSNGPDKPNLL